MTFFLQLLFYGLLLTQAVFGEKSCQAIGEKEFFCIRQHENGFLKALEFSRQHSPVPEAALYFYPEGPLMSFFDRREKNYFLFTEKQQLQEMLIADHYRHFTDGELNTECVGNDCIHYQFEFSSVPSDLLQTGDVVFTGNLNYYSGSAKAVFTHLDIITTIKDGIPWSVSGDVMSKAEIQPLHESAGNTLNWLILRNGEFTKIFQEFWRSLPHSTKENQPELPDQIFCTDIFADLYRQINPKLFQNMDYFSSAFAESLAFHALSDFQVVASHFAEFSTPEEFQKKRQASLQQLKKQWQVLISSPPDFLYNCFFSGFPFLPIIHEEKKLQQLLQYFGSGLWQTMDLSAEKTLTENRSPCPQPTFLPSRSCFNSAANGRICFEYRDNGHLKLLEEYPADKSRTPQQAFYFYPNGQPMVYMDWRRKKYLAFNPDGSLSEKMIAENYIRLENNKSVLVCRANNCQSEKYSFAAPNPQNMQSGDIIFSGNLYPHNGHFQNPLTHTAIFAGYIDGQPCVFTNDIAENPQIVRFEAAFTNTVNYIILRNRDFSREFSDYFAKYQTGKTLRNPKIPHFCGNTLVTLISRLYPEVTEKWDNIDKNHTEIIFKNIYKLFSVTDFRLLTHKKPDELYKKIRLKTIKTKSDIAFIMKNPHNFLYALFAKKFSLLPVTFEREKIEQLLFFMYYHYPLEL